MTFAHNVALGAAWTNDRARLNQAIDAVVAQGSTALADAAFTTLGLRGKARTRTLVLLFTDGDDAGPGKGSRASIEDVIEAAKQSEVTIYTVGFMGKRADGTGNVNQPFLTALAEATGGRPFFPEPERDPLHRDKDVEAVKKAFAEVQRDLHRHYRMAYVPSSVSGGLSGWRNIEVSRWDGALLIGGGGPVADTADFLLRIGPCARAIGDQQLDAAEARQRLMDRLASLHGDAGVALPAACWLVAASAS